MGYDHAITTNLELRTSQPITLVRTTAGEYFSGYAIVWYDGTPATEYRPTPHTIERISRSAVAAVLDSGQNIQARYNHSKDYVLGETANSTLFVRADDKGLQFTIPFDESDPDHAKVRAKIAKGVVKGCSFMGNGRTSVSRTGEDYIRTITTIDALEDVSIVNNPAYTATYCSLVRSQMDEYERWVKTQEFLARMKSKH